MLNAVYKAVIAKLKAASGVTSLLSSATAIYRLEAGQSAALPYIVVLFNSGGGVNLQQTDMLDVSMVVKAVSENPTTAGSVADAVRTALHEAELTFDGGWLHVTCQHTAAFEYAEPVDRRTFYHVGAVYRIRASK